MNAFKISFCLEGVWSKNWKLSANLAGRIGRFLVSTWFLSPFCSLFSSHFIQVSLPLQFQYAGRVFSRIHFCLVAFKCISMHTTLDGQASLCMHLENCFVFEGFFLSSCIFVVVGIRTLDSGYIHTVGHHNSQHNQSQKRQQ